MTFAASGIILAGGSSHRLGQDKRLLRLESTETLLDQTISRVKEIVDDVIVVASTTPPVTLTDRTRLVFDDVPARGPLGGIVAGLRAARFDRSVVVACDLPFLSTSVLHRMLDLSPDPVLIVPRRRDGTLEMLHAIYDRGCLNTVKRLLEGGQWRMAGLASALVDDGLRVEFLQDDFFNSIDPEYLTFFNVNTPDDLIAARRRTHCVTGH